MNEKEIKNLVNLLSWDVSSEKVNEAIISLMDIDEQEVEMLLQPNDKKNWENAAIVLKKIGYPRNKLAISGLLRWLKDMNWPGAVIASEALMEVKVEDLVPFIEDALVEAKNQNDTVWIASLKDLINGMRIKENDFSEKSIFQILDLSEW